MGKQEQLIARLVVGNAGRARYFATVGAVGAIATRFR
jgi:hypothetical protein